MLAEQSTLIIILCKTIIILWLHKNSSFQTNIQSFVSVTLCYDVATDIYNFFFALPPGIRPWWFNIFEGIGAILFLAKTHSIRNICRSIARAQKNPWENFFLITSITIGTIRLVWNLILFIQTHYSREAVEIDHPLYIYTVKFGTTLYPLLLILPALYTLYKALNNKGIPRPYQKPFNDFFYFGIMPKTIADSIQTATPHFIKKLLFDTPLPAFSPVTTQIASLFSFLYIYFTFKMLNTIAYYEDPSTMEVKEYEKTTIHVDAKTFLIEQASPSLEGTMLDSTKATIEKILNIPHEIINIIPLHHNANSYFSSGDENFFLYALDRHPELKTFLEKYSIAQIEHLEACLYFSKNKNLQSIFSFLKENEIFLISIWKNGGDIAGIIAIKNNVFFRPSVSTEKILNIIASYTHAVRLFYKQQSLHFQKELETFKDQTMQEHIKRITACQAESSAEILHTMLDTQTFFFILKRNKIFFPDENTSSLSKEEQNNIEKEALTLLQKVEESNTSILEQKIVINKKTFIFSGNPKNKHIPFAHGTALAFAKDFSSYTHKESYTSHAFLHFTHIGKALNSLIPGNHPTASRYKIDLVSMILDPAPLLIPIATQYASFFLKILAFLENKRIEIFTCPYQSYDSIFFNYHALYDQKSENIENLKKDNALAFINIETLDHPKQKKLAEYCIIYNANPQKRKIYSPERIIFTIEKTIHNTLLDPLLIQSTHFYDIQPPLLCNFSPEELKTIINGCATIFGATLEKEWNYGEKILSSARSSWNLYELMEYIDLQISLTHNKIEPETNMKLEENMREQKLKQAAILGKNALKDRQLMLELASICTSQSEIAHLLGVHRSSVSRFFKDHPSSLQ